MDIENVNIKSKFEKFSDHWNPRIIGELNGQYVKIAKVKGEFIMHHHDQEDELFWVHKGKLFIELEDKTLELNEGEMVIIPHGVNHKPIAPNEVELLLFEPKSTINTGNSESDLIREDLDWI